MGGRLHRYWSIAERSERKGNSYYSIFMCIGRASGESMPPILEHSRVLHQYWEGGHVSTPLILGG